jgi:hypothetical protein
MLECEYYTLHDYIKLFRTNTHEHLKAIINHRLQESKEIYSDVNVAIVILLDQVQSWFQNMLEYLGDVLGNMNIEFSNNHTEEV